MSSLSASNAVYVDVCCYLGEVLASRLMEGTDFADSVKWQNLELGFMVPSFLTSGLGSE